mmetsp:Transcript_26094/g.57485  ORF Transcript_26094/g.57485 Transcript_26094/m.57485 type:complete len:86 (+) Transcript_26094:113-370(+)
MAPTKKVSFGDVTITDYPIIMGDNPACSGVPITIDWEPMGTHTRNLELYEYTRKQRRHGRKKTHHSGAPEIDDAAKCRLHPATNH